MLEGLVSKVRETPHVAIATGVLQQNVGSLDYIMGIHLDEFNQMSGGFQYLSGGPFHDPTDLIVDEVYARAKHVEVGDMVNIGRTWRICGIVVPGKLARTFADIKILQGMYSSDGQISTIFVKADKPENVAVVMSELSTGQLKAYKTYSMEEYTSLISVNSLPELRTFTKVVIGLGLVIGFLVVFLSMYTAVLERTREIGILKALGASPPYIMNMLLRETVLLSIAGSIAGFLMTYGARAAMHVFVPTMPTEIVYAWWPRAAALALIGSLLGAIYPGLKAAKQDAIEALSYD
jgi:putative ABC transport system permease protein